MTKSQEISDVINHLVNLMKGENPKITVRALQMFIMSITGYPLEINYDKCDDGPLLLTSILIPDSPCYIKDSSEIFNKAIRKDATKTGKHVLIFHRVPLKQKNKLPASFILADAYEGLCFINEYPEMKNNIVFLKSCIHKIGSDFYCSAIKENQAIKVKDDEDLHRSDEFYALYTEFKK